MALVIKDKEEFVGRAFAITHDQVRKLIFLFTEFPRYFLSLTPILDYDLKIEGIPENLYSTAEKILIKNFYGIKPRIFSFFTIYDQSGTYGLEELVGRKVAFTNSQWERYEAVICKGQELEDWFSFLSSYSVYYTFPERPDIVADEFKKVFSNGQLSFIMARPSLLDYNKNLRLFEKVARKSKGYLLFLPRRFFITLMPSSSLRLRSIVELFCAMLDPGKLFRAYFSIIKEYLPYIKLAIIEAGNLFEEIVEKITKTSQLLRKTIITTAVKSKDNKAFEMLIVASNGEILLNRKISHNFPMSKLFNKGEKVKLVKIDGEKFLIATNDENLKKFKGFKGRIIILGRLPIMFKGLEITYDVVPEELYMSNVRARNLTIYLNGMKIGVANSENEIIKVYL
ncbi:hypothetical protein DRN86_02180 [Candidatus Geothermarchaeota archaeon]|nr:MAG: hypothetical protein DRN86_02180 [Candidatus Geothermarchaeota archaeon]